MWLNIQRLTFNIQRSTPKDFARHGGQAEQASKIGDARNQVVEDPCSLALVAQDKLSTPLGITNI
jgi:hypothetical protein